ncbi:TPA: ATP-binding protein [Pyrococcus horikoshii]|uniref:ATP-binding protein n=1 Tax=Pyrococcus horikoshii TaxID=53953 RepID=A0A832T9T3_PYRHR|nr:ATP-binding protein [Pyrococcus horikoshii]
MREQEFRRLLPYLLRQGERIVLDEFHRLSDKTFSLLQGLSGLGSLILITSTMHYFRSIVGKNSPILGLFELKNVSLVDPRDAIVFSNSLGFKGREMLEVACLVRESWIVPKLERVKGDIFNSLDEELRIYVPHLVGEVFEEEDIAFTSRYSGILEAVADGRNSTSEISSYLFSLGLIEKDNPGLISQYLKNLVETGLLVSRLVFGKRRKAFKYRHASPLIDLAFYMPSLNQMLERVRERFLRARLPTYMEWFFEELLEKHFGMQPVKIAKPELEVDIALADFKKIKVVGEVKWKENVGERDIRNTEEKLGKFRDDRRIMIVPEKDVLKREPRGIEVWDWRDFIKVDASLKSFKSSEYS